MNINSLANVVIR